LAAPCLLRASSRDTSRSDKENIGAWQNPHVPTNSVNPVWWHTDGIGELVLAHADLVKKFGPKDLVRVGITQQRHAFKSLIFVFGGTITLPSAPDMSASGPDFLSLVRRGIPQGPKNLPILPLLY
jgi:hypothetical protein